MTPMIKNTNRKGINFKKKKNVPKCINEQPQPSQYSNTPDEEKTIKRNQL